MIEAPASKSFTAERASSKTIRISPLVWMNLVCLDAPLVAVSWQMLFARSFGVRVAHGGTVALFLTAWLIYLADRFGDSLSLGEDDVMSLRQRFSLRWRGFWLAGIALVALADLLVAATQLNWRSIFFGAVVGAAALVYLLVNRVRPSFWRVLPLKEISIGFIFAAGTMVGVAPSLTTAALLGWLLFAALCSLNCIFIAIWERDLDFAQQRVSIATEFSRTRAFALPALAAICLTSAAFVFNSADACALYVCIASSAALLAAVHIARENIQPDIRTALADLVLLTPIVALLI